MVPHSTSWIYSIGILRAVSEVSRPLHEDAARARAQTANVSRPRVGFRVRLYSLFGLIAVALTVVIVLRPTAGGHSRKPEVSTTVALRPAVADFALLRSAQGKPLPRTYLRTVRRLPAKFELMPSGARESKDGVWLIPGRNGLCVLKADSEGPGGSCGSLHAAESEGVWFDERDPRSGQELWTGAVPDGTVRVRALAADGATVAVATPRSSIYRLTARNALTISAER
jgi:hypothetical protein